jgi:hypothetical protein
VQPPASEEIALAALEWIDASAVTDGDGVWWSSRPSSAEPDPGLYHGGAGIVLALLEAHAHLAASAGPTWRCAEPAGSPPPSTRSTVRAIPSLLAIRPSER